MAKTVIVLRRDPKSLPEALIGLLKANLGSDVEMVRTDPEDYKEHLRICEEAGSPSDVFVYLPDRPIPSAAMEAGYRHIALVPIGNGMGLREVEPLKPVFKPIVL